METAPLLVYHFISFLTHTTGGMEMRSVYKNEK